MLRRLFPSLAGAASAAPKPLAHRPILKRDAERMRWAGDGGFVLPRENPGIRVEAGFVSETEGAELAAELDAAATEYGYPYEGNTAVHLLDSDSGAVEATLDGVVNNVRVTGRIERPDIDQKIPPWGYVYICRGTMYTCRSGTTGRPMEATDPPEGGSKATSYILFVRSIDKTKQSHIPVEAARKFQLEQVIQQGYLHRTRPEVPDFRRPPAPRSISHVHWPADGGVLPYESQE